MVKVYSKDVNSIFYNYRITEKNYDISEYDEYRKLIIMISSMMVNRLNIVNILKDSLDNELKRNYINEYLSNFNNFNPEKFIKSKSKDELDTISNKLKMELKEANSKNLFKHTKNCLIESYISKIIYLDDNINFFNSIKIIFVKFYKKENDYLNKLFNKEYLDKSILWINNPIIDLENHFKNK